MSLYGGTFLDPNLGNPPTREEIDQIDSRLAVARGHLMAAGQQMVGQAQSYLTRAQIPLTHAGDAIQESIYEHLGQAGSIIAGSVAEAQQLAGQHVAAARAQLQPTIEVLAPQARPRRRRRRSRTPEVADAEDSARAGAAAASTGTAELPEHFPVGVAAPPLPAGDETTRTPLPPAGSVMTTPAGGLPIRKYQPPAGGAGGGTMYTGPSVGMVGTTTGPCWQWVQVPCDQGGAVMATPCGGIPIRKPGASGTGPVQIIKPVSPGGGTMTTPAGGTPITKPLPPVGTVGGLPWPGPGPQPVGGVPILKGPGGVPQPTPGGLGGLPLPPPGVPGGVVGGLPLPGPEQPPPGAVGGMPLPTPSPPGGESSPTPGGPVGVPIPEPTAPGGTLTTEPVTSPPPSPAAPSCPPPVVQVTCPSLPSRSRKKSGEKKGQKKSPKEQKEKTCSDYTVKQETLAKCCQLSIPWLALWYPGFVQAMRTSMRSDYEILWAARELGLCDAELPQPPECTMDWLQLYYPHFVAAAQEQGKADDEILADAALLGLCALPSAAAAEALGTQGVDVVGPGDVSPTAAAAMAG